MRPRQRIFFSYDCRTCPGDGVVRPLRPGVDWPSACACEARTGFTQYQLGRVLEEDARTIVRVEELRATSGVALRVLAKIERAGLLAGTT